jgi:IS5 family transposase
MENCSGLAVAGLVTHATGTAERDAASELSAGLAEGATLCGDKNYDAEAFVEGLKARKIVPHVAINGTVSKTGEVRQTAVPPEVAQSPGYAISLRCRKWIEEIFGWIKMTAGFTQLKVRGLDKVKAAFTFALAAYNIVRLPKLLRPTGEVCPTGGK